MPNVMFLAVDEGYPDTILVSLADQHAAELEQRNWEISVEDDDWEDWEDIIFGNADLVDLPATVDHTCVVFVY